MGQVAQSLESEFELTATTAPCRMAIGNGMAAAATSCAINPLPKAASSTSARRCRNMPLLISIQIAPGTVRFKLAVS